MLQSIMTNRGQITIPAAIREKLGLFSGNRLEFLLSDDKIIRKRNIESDFSVL